MSKEKASKIELLNIFGEKAKECRTDYLKIYFSTQAKKNSLLIQMSQRYVRKNIPKDLENAI